MHDPLEAWAVERGPLGAAAILEHEVTRLRGRRSQRRPGRSRTRHGPRRGVVMLAGPEPPIERPRPRGAAGGGAGPVAADTRSPSPAATPRAVLRRMGRGVSPRD